MMAKTAKQKKKWSRSGETMVEIIVSFALIAIFAVAATTVITSAVRLYYEIKAEDNGTQAANVIMDKIAGELASAQGFIDTEQIVIRKTDEGKSIVFFMDRTDAPVFITSATKTQCSYANVQKFEFKKNISQITVADPENPQDLQEIVDLGAPIETDYYLLLYFYPLTGQKQDGSGDNDTVLYQQVAWTFDDAVYYGYSIKNLEFTQASRENGASGVAPQYNNNIIKIELTLENKHYNKEYSTTRYVECYNFADDTDKIMQIDAT